MKIYLIIWTVFGLTNHCMHCGLMWMHAAELFLDAHVPHIDTVWHVASLLIGFVFVISDNFLPTKHSHKLIVVIHACNGIIAMVQLAANEGYLLVEAVNSIEWRVFSTLVLCLATIAIAIEMFQLLNHSKVDLSE